MQQKQTRIFDRNILSAWQAEMTGSGQDPNVRQQLLERQQELMPRFARHYEELKALPRRMRRSLQRQWKRSLAGVALLLALGAQPALAATINVGGTCTLVRAIVAANNDATAMGCRKGSGADTIVLLKGSTQTLTAVNNTNYGPVGLPTIRSIITIQGNGSTIRRAASAPKFQVLAVAASGNLGIDSATVSGGAAAGRGGAGFGAGIFNRGKIALTHSTISGNVTGILNEGTEEFFSGVFFPADVKIINSKISGNSGTGISSDAGANTVTDSTISGNGGNGIDSSYFGDVTLTNSTISDNKGTGVRIEESGATITNSTISGNSYSGFCGGGVASRSEASISVTNSTITGNSASSRGGGVCADSGLTKLVSTLVSGNHAADQGREVWAPDASYITVGSHNLFGYSGNAGVFGFSPGVTDIVPSQPLGAILNTTLANNGGPTQTNTLIVGSSAIDAVNDGTCPPPATDQRGIRRPQGNGDGGAACDIGSYELVGSTQPPPPPPPMGKCQGINATITGTANGETLTGTNGADVIQGFAGNDVLNGIGGNDLICGGPGNDTLSGGAGNDRLFGEVGTDTCNGSTGRDQAKTCERVTGVP